MEGSPFVAVALTVLMIAINGILASVEIAMMGLNEVKLRNKTGEGNKKARMLLTMKRNPSDFLSTVQIGITLAGLLSGAFAADSLATPIVRIFANLGVSGAALTAVRYGAVLLITFITTYFMLVFGELVPKRAAMARPEQTAYGVVSLLNVLSKATKPLVRLLSASTNLVLRIAGIDPVQQDALVTEDEILLMMQEGRDQGMIEEAEMEFVRNAFEFTDLRARDVMIHRTEIDALPSGAKITDAVELMKTTRHGKFPVYGEDLDDILGILYISDIVALYPQKDRLAADSCIEDLIRKPVFVPESKPIAKLFSEMKKHGDKLVLVADEYGGTAGMITLTDIIEEIVGELDAPREEIAVVNEDGSYILNGLMRMGDAAELLGINLDSNDYDTLSGFIIHRLGYLPTRDEATDIVFHGYTFHIAEMGKTYIKRVRVEKV